MNKINIYKKNVDVGDNIMVHAYKFKRWLYRTWEYPRVIFKNEDYIILDMTNSHILTNEKNSLRSFNSHISKPTYWYFFKDKWFNFIITVNKHYYPSGYINVASPWMYEEGAIKYYDFDLDFRINSDFLWNEIDFNDFAENQVKFNYPNELINAIKKSETEIIKLLKSNFFQNLMSMNNIKYLDKLSHKGLIWNRKLKD